MEESKTPDDIKMDVVLTFLAAYALKHKRLVVSKKEFESVAQLQTAGQSAGSLVVDTEGDDIVLTATRKEDA